ncbi:acetolactate synthase small subunit [Crassaminicella thermophila]|uniref:Acetolactate synthase small subunit n=1 Tax=Crassaminicella thermophila TaxID=2599308 RepID=A0A5C0SKJ1_CRATE|nr:acetolactate synthase small subunit [Crassaminicella thermophila]QEK13459.1 acetolactate synthase small subunit [Crassaminicella thermophila]
MNRHVLSILVENNSGVLSRIAGLFSRRGYNIDSLSVGETENPKISRMTITVNGDDYILEQIQKQLHKLINVIKIVELKPEKSIYRELILVKVRADSKNRATIIETVNIFRGKIIDVSSDTLTIELTGDFEKISAFTELIKPFGIIELVRTGFTGLQRGNVQITD